MNLEQSSSPAAMRSRAVGPLWGLASLVALAGLGVCASEVSFAEDALGGLVQTGAEGASISSGQLKQLKLCDCHFQQSGDGDDGGKPEDLTCDTEGFFIAGFERAGVFSVRAELLREMVLFPRRCLCQWSETAALFVLLCAGLSE